jgi:hypothetical protein
MPVLIALSVASCSAQDGTAGESSDPPPPPEEKRLLPETRKNPDLQSLVDMATSDLVDRLKAKNAGEIKVLRAEHVTWPSSALGCPQPDQGYLMVLTPGVLIQLNASGQTWQYHSTLRGPPFLCEAPGRIETPVPRDPTLDPT